MIAVILVTHRLRINPDNIATPLAASFGDVVSITVLANVANFLYQYHGMPETKIYCACDLIFALRAYRVAALCDARHPARLPDDAAFLDFRRV